jgi:rhodanese-related sulfurtransferase
VALTGASEKALRRAGWTDFEKIYIHPNNHAGYFPGARRLTVKLLFRRSDGRVLGAQAVGFEGVDKRIDVIAMAIQMGARVTELEEAELCYAPQYGAAKDPVNFAGMVAANVLRGDMPLAHWDEADGALLLDVRDEDEFAQNHAERAINIPLSQLRDRLHELDPSAEVRTYCAIGQRGYLATRILNQNGFRARNLCGGLASAPCKTASA